MEIISRRSTNTRNLSKGKADTAWQVSEQRDLPIGPLREGCSRIHQLPSRSFLTPPNGFLSLLCAVSPPKEYGQGMPAPPAADARWGWERKEQRGASTCMGSWVAGERPAPGFRSTKQPSAGDSSVVPCPLHCSLNLQGQQCHLQPREPVPSCTQLADAPRCHLSWSLRRLGYQNATGLGGIWSQ